MILDHIGIAVRRIEEAADRLCATLGYERKTELVTNTRQKVNVLFLEKSDSLDLKLIEPADDSSPLWAFLRKGGGLHHLCFRVPNVTATCEELRESRVRIVTPPEPGEAFDDNLIAFSYLGHGISAEFIDTEVRRGLLDAASGALA